MDASHFDRLTRVLAAGAASRRGVLGFLAGGLLGVAAGGGETAAHDPLAKCRKIDNRKKRKKCIKRAKKHNADHDAEETEPACGTGFEPCGESCVPLGQLGSSCNTGGLGSCAAGVQTCHEASSTVFCQQTHTPTAETCNGLDDNCDGEYDEGLTCPSGQRCESGACCKENVFGPENACTSGDECCSGNCVTLDFGKFCRPEDCLPTGGDCSSDPSVCCSSMCNGDNTCQ